MSKLGFIGFGAMGSRIVKNFLLAGHEVKGFNRDSEKVKAISGVELVDSPAAAAAGVDVVFVMVRDDEASRQVWTDPDHGVLSAIDNKTIAVDLSTLSLAWTKELGVIMSERNLAFLEAPVVGTRPQADQKQLVVLSAGEKEALDTVKPILETTAAKVVPLQERGQGAALKLVINTLFGTQSIVFAEMTQTMRKLGFSDEAIMNILPELPVTAPIMKMMLNLMTEKRFDPLFPIDLVEKDFGYAEELIASQGVQPLITKACREIYQQAKDHELGDKNISAIIALYHS
ncbi:NAD(P)-dependent oxidoreductase [Pseudobacteriovorax antillogorgiicola]|uniref:3-hydroxyisobutyrate dehydrogenase n=1 Tax=Pseudobacteriovorax antillogorgiicola TaxID=1513793 RepID=A0A1Y6CRE6_9BACT|nr:NAD(P)-dependent oxidoreductase [Pseudobacteriovorax antillogorgiicola]TCS42218.1 3-hydroxyisobutyrate dehydrogenase/hypothetical protein [Pseudobacteriovorax antillogorgiicola]SMF82780.1 3-hydroxyisobutyrate dehydrogenase/hypothetical protein [Pseudobacteriovorax antillogorgiicola]